MLHTSVPLTNNCCRYTYLAINPVAVKSLMKAIGLPAGSLRRPLRDLQDDALQNGIRIVNALGLKQK
ncbi:MAG: hypothetical protein ACR5LD_12120 [Symbiopectobacterium sp.]